MSVDTIFRQAKEYKDLTLFSMFIIKANHNIDSVLICGGHRPKNLQINCDNTKFIVSKDLTGICIECKHQINIFNFNLSRIYVCNKVSWIFV